MSLFHTKPKPPDLVHTEELSLDTTSFHLHKLATETPNTRCDNQKSNLFNSPKNSSLLYTNLWKGRKTSHEKKSLFDDSHRELKLLDLKSQNGHTIKKCQKDKKPPRVSVDYNEYIQQGNFQYEHILPKTLKGRNLEEKTSNSPKPDELIKNSKSTLMMNDRTLVGALDSQQFEVMGTFEFQAAAIVMSSDETVAFMVNNCKIVSAGIVCTLGIFNVSSQGFSILIGSLELMMPQDIREKFWSTYNPFSLILSSDEQTLFMSTYWSLQIIDVSNISLPMITSSFIPPVRLPNICTLALSQDEKTVFMGTQSSLLHIINVTNLDSPELLLSYGVQGYSVSMGGACAMSLYTDLLYIGKNTLVQVLNVTNLTSPTLVGSFDIPIYAVTATYSQNHQTAYFCVYDDYENLLDLTIMNITNITAPVTMSTISLESPPSNPTARSTHVFLSIDNRHLFLLIYDYMEIVDISNPSSLVLFPPQSNIVSGEFIAFFSDKRRILLSHLSSISLLELYINVPSDQIFSMQNSTLVTFPYQYPSLVNYVSFDLSRDGNTLYYFVYNQSVQPSSLIVLDVSNPASPVPLPPFQLLYPPYGDLEISDDGNRLVVGGKLNATYMVQAYDIQSGACLSTTSLGVSPNTFTLSPNGDFVYLIYEGTKNQLLVMDVTSQRTTSFYTFVQPVNNTLQYLSLSPDGQTLFITGTALSAYNVSTPLSPVLLSIMSSANGYVGKIAITADGNTGFANMGTVKVVNLTSPQTLNVIETTEIKQTSIQLSADGQTLFGTTSTLILPYNISRLDSPRLLGYYNVDYYKRDLILSPDLRTAYLADGSGLHIIDFKPNYILYLPSETIFLGEPYTTTLMVLAKNSNGTYDCNPYSYKFTDVSLYTIEVDDRNNVIETYPPLPNWITFDSSNGIISCTPNSKSQIGLYQVYGTISLQISSTAFLNISSINTTSQATNLMITLISLGYLDNQGFLTPSFDPGQSMLLTSDYSDNETEIRSVLEEYYIKAMMTVYVNPSLVLDFVSTSSGEPSITVTSPSLNPLSLNITLGTIGSIRPQFVSTGSSLVLSFQNNRSTVTMVGSQLDINHAFSSLVVFLNGLGSCNGTITISDAMNPTYSQSISNLSDYFYINAQPIINFPYFQYQVGQVPINTGEQFIIQFDSSTFSDVNNEPLTLSLYMQDSSQQLPSWLTLKALSLLGTPPLQITDREIPLKILVSNEYQSTEVTFVLSISISWMYAFKLVSTYGGVLIGLLGALAIFRKVYNIVGKKWYRYPKDFYIRVDEEITADTIYPMAFIGEAVLESKYILKELHKNILKEIGNRSKEEIREYFVDRNTNQIDETKLLQGIENAVQEILVKDSTKIPLYTRKVDSRKELINQLIFNEIVMRIINIKREKPTNDAFESLKKDIFTMVELENFHEDGICRFAVNESKLDHQLRSRNIKVMKPVDQDTNSNRSPSSSIASSIQNLSLNLSEAGGNEKIQTQRKSTDNSLVPFDISSPPQQAQATGINLNLLINAIKAYAFKLHHLDIRATNVTIVSKERLEKVIPPEPIIRFLKLDLTPIGLSGNGHIGYGIKYETKKGVLSFCGTTEHDIKNKTLVVQIVEIKGRILRELWLNGTHVEPENEPLTVKTQTVL